MLFLGELETIMKLVAHIESKSHNRQCADK